MFLKFFLSYLFLVFSTSIYAQEAVSSRMVYLAGDLKMSYGTEASEDATSIRSRKMISYAAEASAGARFYHMILGASGEYAFVRQLTKPANVSNSNTQGKLLAVSPLFGFEYYIFKLLFKLPSILVGSYTLDQKTTSGLEVVYKKADILSVQFQWLKTANTFWGIEYQKLTFKTISKGGVDTILTDKNRFNLKTISLLYGFTY